MKPKVFVTRPVFPDALALLDSVAAVEVWPEDVPPAPDVLRDEVRDAVGLFCLLTDRIDAPVLAGAPKLRIVSNMAVGYNNIDVDAATARGIYVGNTPGVLTETTADFAFALLAAAARRIPEGQAFARQGSWKTWSPMLLLGRDLYRATLGIVGLGRIGLAMARRARGFEMRVLYHGPRRKVDAERELGIQYASSLADLLGEADFVSVHVPLTPATRGLIGEKELRAMRPGAILVNTSRGEVVDQRSLYTALKERAIAGAALDVTDPEPLPASDPLFSFDNVLITPHIGSASHVTRLKMAMMAAQNIVDVLRGGPPTYCVNASMLSGPQWKTRHG